MSHETLATIGRVVLVLLMMWAVGIILALLGVFNRMFHK